MGRLLASIGVLCATFAPAPSVEALAPSLCSETAWVSPVEPEGDHGFAAQPSPVRDEELPWCASAEDPRCSPLDNGTAPSSVGVRKAPAVDCIASSIEPFSPALHEFMPYAGLFPRAGTPSRLERPPRSARRVP